MLSNLKFYVLKLIYNTTEERNIKANYLVQIKLININEERKKASGEARNFLMNIWKEKQLWVNGVDPAHGSNGKKGKNNFLENKWN